MMIARTHCFFPGTHTSTHQFPGSSGTIAQYTLVVLLQAVRVGKEEGRGEQKEANRARARDFDRKLPQ